MKYISEKYLKQFVKQFSTIVEPFTDKTKVNAKRTKKNLALQKTDLLTWETCKSFNELLATFINLLFFNNLDIKQKIKLQTNISGYLTFEILSQKQDSE